MLVLSRRVGERIIIGKDVYVTVLEVCYGKARLGIDAPTEVPIYRDEIYKFAALTSGTPCKLSARLELSEALSRVKTLEDALGAITQVNAMPEEALQIARKVLN